jgi:hypothetical protein
MSDTAAIGGREPGSANANRLRTGAEAALEVCDHGATLAGPIDGGRGAVMGRAFHALQHGSIRRHGDGFEIRPSEIDAGGPGHW